MCAFAHDCTYRVSVTQCYSTITVDCFWDYVWIVGLQKKQWVTTNFHWRFGQSRGLNRGFEWSFESQVWWRGYPACQIWRRYSRSRPSQWSPWQQLLGSDKSRWSQSLLQRCFKSLTNVANSISRFGQQSSIVMPETHFLVCQRLKQCWCGKKRSSGRTIRTQTPWKHLTFST